MRNSSYIWFGILFVSVFFVFADAPPQADEKEVLDLTSGDALGKWRAPHGEWFTAGTAAMSRENEKQLAATPGQGILVNGKSGRTSNLFSQFEHGDVEAHIEFLIPRGSNSGVYFMGRYEIQILDSYGVERPKYGDCGGIYQRWTNSKGFEGHAPKVNASKPAGEWQTFDVVFRAPRFDKDGKKVANAQFVKVVHNGQVIHENVEVTGPTRAAGFADEKPVGPMMIQADHGPVAFRRFQLRSLSSGKDP